MSRNPLGVLFAGRDVADSRPLRLELRRRGARVLMASSGEHAIRVAEEVKPDLVILDDSLEGADSFRYFMSVLQRAEVILLRSPQAQAPVDVGLGILFSAAKPVSKDSLLDVIATAFPGRLDEAPAEPPPLCTVLCVDDEAPFLASLERLLGRHGYRVSTFEDPKRALEAIPEVAPDLAIVDVMMPGMDGRELSRLIRRDYRELIPIVMLSARGSSADMASGFRHGINYYLTKPFEPQRLLDVVDYFAMDLDSEEREVLAAKL